MKIYTRTGDRGETGLFGGARVSKASDRVDAYGEIDELNSTLGMSRAASLDPEVDALLADIQSQLFDLGAELATAPGKEEKLSTPRVGDIEVERLERAIDSFEEPLAQLKTFVLPGGCDGAARLHLARCVCRRAERRLVALRDTTPIREELIRYVNRLSDLLFTLARHANHREGVEDVPWSSRLG